MEGKLLKGMGTFTRVLNGIAGVSLLFLMLLTVADVFLRLFGRPILGTYELVSFTGILVFGLALPFTSWGRQHIFVDFLIGMFPTRVQDAFNIATRIIVMALIFWIGWNLMKYGMGLHRSGEVSASLRMPFYPFAYVLATCCVIECLVLVCDVIKIVKGSYNG
jgi:TRAP-type C4-dicarboxylate transport system permease small subunit